MFTSSLINRTHLLRLSSFNITKPIILSAKHNTHQRISLCLNLTCLFVTDDVIEHADARAPAENLFLVNHPRYFAWLVATVQIFRVAWILNHLTEPMQSVKLPVVGDVRSETSRGKGSRE